MFVLKSSQNRLFMLSSPDNCIKISNLLRRKHPKIEKGIVACLMD